MLNWLAEEDRAAPLIVEIGAAQYKVVPRLIELPVGRTEEDIGLAMDEGGLGVSKGCLDAKAFHEICELSTQAASTQKNSFS